MAKAEQSVEDFKGQARLPLFANPKRYVISLRVDLARCAFSGSATIAVAVASSTRFLVLNAADLAVDAASVRFTTPGSSEELQPSEVVAVEEDEILVVGFDTTLPIGDGELRIEFIGTLNDQMRGFYRSKYEYNGEIRNMAVTQFEAVDARRCFPCWDEPAFKATFEITLEVPSELVALSNMPVAEEKVNGVVKTLSFEESPIMSTYLVAIVVGLFDYIEDKLPDGTKVRVYCQVGKSSQGKFALDVAVKSLQLYENYFAVPYPLPKLDMVAIPDFVGGAMENYGLVTYQETALLYDDRLSSASNKQSVAITVAHELAHQWFGNLVTMEWWTHLWLNEGFASWVSYLAVDSLFPEWKIWTQFLEDTAAGLMLDALSESHPIEVEINHANEIDAIFDSISYDKGASVIRMLQSYLGAESFQQALALYIKKNAYSNAKTEDLWAVLEEESGEPVKDLMNSWTKQQGYPVIYANLKKHELELEQAQFLSDGSSGTGMWIIPVTLCCGSYNPQEKFLLKSKYHKLDVKELVSSHDPNNENGERFWIKLNVDQTGFYRVKYDDELAAGIRYAVQANKLSLMDKIGVVEDSYALSVACKQTLPSLLFLLSAYGEEFDYTVLSHVIVISRKIADVVMDATPELANDIKLFLINLLLSAAKKLGWDPKDGENHLDVMLRADLLVALVRLGHEETINEAVKRFNIFLNDRNTPLLPPDNRKAAYLGVMQTVSTSNRSGFESLLRIYTETDQSEERVRVLGSLASCPDKEIVLEALNFLLTPKVRNQDAIYGLGISRQGRETAWGWLKENWEYISKTWVASFLISRFVSAIVSPFKSSEKAVEVEEFFASRVKPSFERELKQSLERVRINAKWVESIRGEQSLADAVKELVHKA
ncbi:aminopeptidase M1-B-like isoform X1 [Ananas comosus]|uniref:Aminopeptidase n=3 Tax=Ananas comosus TaxID=4615 RepID=A0A6P5FW60_ANACO|nr:aminopeptidase M1-B-like isoform X1 [Ananas comosus]